jgi:hypothetical protein
VEIVRYWLVLALLAGLSLVSGSLYRTWLVANARRRMVAATVCLSALVLLLWLGRGNGWRLTALVIFVVFVLLSRLIGPWMALHSLPVVSRPMHELRDSLLDKLVTEPCLSARLECYDTYAILDCAYSVPDSATGQHGERFSYDNACIACEIQASLEAVEAAAARASPDAAAGIAGSYRRQFAESRRFVIVFKPRPPDVLWQWGHRPLPIKIIPEGLCPDHIVPVG